MSSSTYSMKEQSRKERPTRKLDRTIFWLLGPAILFLICMFLIPIVHILKLSVQSQAFGGDASSTLKHYVRFFGDSYYMSIVLFTIRISVIVTVLDLFLGYPVAFMIARAGKHVARLLYVIIISPLLVSLVVRTYGWMVILAPNGIINQTLKWLGYSSGLHLMYNEFGVIIGMTHILLPIFVLPATGAIQNIDRSLEEAAETLGANRIHVFLRVLLPLSMPGVIAGVFLVFILTMGSFVTPVLLGGDKGHVISSLVFDNSVLLANWPFGSAISIIFLAISLSLVVLYNRLSTRIMREQAFTSV